MSSSVREMVGRLLAPALLRPPLHSLRAKVVVVTGASSGIGRVTALAFAGHGAAVVLTARRANLLAAVASECERAGGRALAVPADVTDETALRAVADRAAGAFGGIDVWVNNAGVYHLGELEGTPPDVFRRVIEVNLFGCVGGSRAALPHLRRRGGVLINVSSVFGLGGARYASAYAASKFATRGFTESLRQELRGTGVRVCLVYPATIDTPIFRAAGNHTGRAIRVPRPLYDPERVAGAIVECAVRPRAERYVGGSGRALASLRQLSLALYDRAMSLFMARVHLEPRAAPATAGNLFAPLPPGAAPDRGPDGPRTVVTLPGDSPHAASV